METDGVLAEITSESFQDCIGGPLEEILKKNEKIHEVIPRKIIKIIYILKKKMMRADLQKRKESLNIKLNELYLIKKLGKIY
jgi:hypothetical protein